MGANGSTPPEGNRFKPGDDPRRNAGGRTPTKWLREFLNAANDKSEGGQTRRMAIAEHLFEVATSWKVMQFGRDIEVASARDSVEAAKLLYGYDMGTPVKSVELSSPDGSMSPGVAGKSTAEVRHELERMLGLATGEAEPTPAAGTESKVEPGEPAATDSPEPSSVQ